MREQFFRRDPGQKGPTSLIDFMQISISNYIFRFVTIPMVRCPAALRPRKEIQR